MLDCFKASTMVKTVFFSKKPVFYKVKWKWKSPECKMSETKVAHNVSS